MTTFAPLQPFDQYNRELKHQVHPDDWTNPTPSGRYNLVVIGAGTAGLVTAAGAAGLGAKVALIERDLMGGDCLNVGCVPSKSLISPARTAATIKKANQFGVSVNGKVSVDFPAVMERMRKIRAGISHHDSAQRFTELGVDVFFGQGRFTSGDTIQVADHSLKFKKAVIATGARAARLPIDGIDQVNPLTNESVFSLTALPAQLTVIGAGPIGCEMAQTFARFGSVVTLVEMAPRIMSREDPDAVEIVHASLINDGVNIVTNASVKRFEQRNNQKITVYQRDGEMHEIAADEILIGIGRAPNVEGLGLDDAGVQYDKQSGVTVNDKLQTSNSRIYAAGDVASKFKFTHAADFMARIVIQNSLFLGWRKLSRLVIPWCTYTSPELAHVGQTPEMARDNGLDIDTYTQQFSKVDRAIIDGQPDGFARVHVRKGTDKIVGATVVAENAGDLIGQFVTAMTWNIGLGKLGSVIAPYPTQAEAIRKLGDQYNKTRLTPFVQSLFQKWLKWTR
jgi:pyruvate/2-oxoglutarate dehydrogenase complex dihydrolipoamide dehydrogenase (E3) component